MPGQRSGTQWQRMSGYGFNFTCVHVESCYVTFIVLLCGKEAASYTDRSLSSNGLATCFSSAGIRCRSSLNASASACVMGAISLALLDFRLLILHC